MLNAHTDVVGSLIRPDWLLDARAQRDVGKIGDDELAAIEDRAVDEAIALQETAGIDVVTDGEMRRLSFQSQLAEAVDGFGSWDIDAFLWGDWRGDEQVGDYSLERPAGLGVVDKLRRRRWLSVDEFVYLKDRTSRVPKLSLPSPSLFSNFWSAERSAGVYPALDDFLVDVAEILREEVDELVRRGATYLQLDAPHYPLLLDPRSRAFYEGQGWDLEKWLRRGVELDNHVIGDHTGVTFGFHLCRGNQGSRWLVEGSFEPLVAPIFHHVRAQRLLLEHDDERAGSFEALRAIPEDKTVVLGLVTTKRGACESVTDLRASLDDAARHFPLEQLALSPQCGFASSVVGNDISIREQAAKLRVIAETAAEVWG